MAWMYLPQSLSAPDTTGSALGLDEQSQICARWLTWRGSVTRSQIWSQRFRRVSWMTLLSGMTCQPLTADRLRAWLGLSMPACPASPGVSPESEKEPKTNDGYGATFSASSLKSNQSTSFLRKCLGLFQEEVLVLSYPTLPKQGSMRSGVVLQRQSAARPTSASGCSSWPTSTVADSQDMNPKPRPSRIATNRKTEYLARMVQWPTPNVPNRGPEMDKSHRPESGGIDLQSAVKKWPTPNVPNGGRSSNTTNYHDDGSKRQVDLAAKVKNWPTPAAQNYRDGKASPETMASNSRPLQEVVISGPQAVGNRSTNGKNQELFTTSCVADSASARNSTATRYKIPPTGIHAGNIPTDQVVPKQWQAVKCPGGGDRSRSGERKGELPLGGQGKGKLNPAWVCSLMNLPVGWVTITTNPFEDA